MQNLPDAARFEEGVPAAVSHVKDSQERAEEDDEQGRLP
jgi:hypothetical protein